MRICSVIYDFQELGGLEEYAVALAIALRQDGHDVRVVSTAWASPANQYVMRLREAGIEILQPPKLLSELMSDWDTKDGIVRGVAALLSPFAYLLAAPLAIARRQAYAAALASSKGRIASALGKLIQPDRRRPYIRWILDRLRRDWNPEVLHVQGYTSNLLFVNEWADEKGVALVYEEHQTPDPRFGWWTSFGESVNKATRVVAVSEISAEALRTVCGITRPIVVRSPLLEDPISPGWRRTGSRETGAIRIVAVARLYVTKGLGYLLEAVAEIAKDHPGVELRIHGDGLLRDELHAQARGLGLDADSIFAGPFRKEQLRDIMAEADLFAMPSILEGQPLALVEAMAFGCPIVVTKVGGIPELIVHGENGLLCEPANVPELTACIRRMIEDPTLRERLGAAARASYEQGPYQPGALSRQLSEIYRASVAEACLNPS